MSQDAHLALLAQAMLKQEIQGLLLAWRAHLQSATLIFVHAPAGNAAPIFSTEPCVLERQDKRIRSIPFNTRRPTFSETQRIMRMLLTVYSVEEDDRAGAESTEQTGRSVLLIPALPCTLGALAIGARL